MAQTIKLRRSGVEGSVPNTSQLALGEVAINTFDGRVFIHKSGSGPGAPPESIEHLITTNSETTGSINLIGNITASGDISASGDIYATNFIGTVANATNADTLDSLDSTQFVRSDADDTITGDITFGSEAKLIGTQASTTQDFSILEKFLANPASEAGEQADVRIVNNLAGANKWATITLTDCYAADRTTLVTDLGNDPFDGTSAFKQLYQNVAGDPLVIQIDLPNQINWSAWVGIIFGNVSWRTKSVKIETFRNGAWQTECDLTNQASHIVSRRVANNDSNGVTKIKYTLDDLQNTDNHYIRILSLFNFNYRTGAESYGGVHYIDKYKDSEHYSNILPATDSTYNLGSNTQRYANIYADDISASGNITASGDISASGTVRVEHFYSSDDATVADLLTAGRFQTVGTSIFGVYATPNLNTSLIYDAFRFYGHITASGNISASGDLLVNTSDAAGSSYNTLMVDTNTGKVYHTGSYGGGGGATITGTDTHVLFFDGANTPAGDAGFTYNKTTNSITAITNITASGNISASGAGTHILGGNLDVYGKIRSLGSSVVLENGNITASADISASGKLYSNDALIKNAFTASVAGNTAPSDFLPTTVGGTYSPPTFAGGGGPGETTIAYTDVDISDFVNLPGSSVNEASGIFFPVDLPNRVDGTSLKILSISASGDLNGVDATEYIYNLNVAGNILVVNFGNDSNMDPNDLNTFVPIWEYDEPNVANINGNAGFHVVNAVGFDGLYNGDEVFGQGASAFISDGTQMLCQLSLSPFSVSSLKLRFEVEYITPGSTINNDGDFGKGLAVGNLPNNYASLIYNVSRDITPNDTAQDIPKGLAITLGQATGSAPTINTSYIDVFSAITPLDNTSTGMFKVTSLQPIVVDGLLSGDVAWSNLSDARLKENITYSDKGLNEIKKIKLRDFNFKGFELNTTGFIAQELYEVIPEAVRIGSDNNNDVHESPWMVSETKLIPYLVGAIQQQQKLIEDLQDQINTLSKK